MKDKGKTKKQLIGELTALHHRISELEASESEHKQTEEVLRKNFSIIGTVTRSVHQLINLEEVLGNAAKSMHKNIKGADNVSIYLVEGKEAILKTYKGYSDEVMKGISRIPYPQGFTWKTIMEGKPRYVPDAEKELIIGAAGREVGTKSYLSVPINFEDETVGCINVSSFKKDIFSEQDLKLLEIVSAQIEMAIKNANQTEALLQSEERYRALFNQSPVGVYTFDKEYKIIQCNERMTQILQSPRDRIEGLDIQGLKDQSFISLMKKALEGETCQREGFYEATISPAKLWLSVCVTPLRDTDGNVIGGIAVVEDTTARKRVEEELLKVAKLESLSVFASGVAHDFNNLLTAILGNISLVRMHANPEGKAYERLTEAEKATLRTKDLTGQLLTFAKGGVPIKKTASIGELIKDSASFVLRGSDIRCEFSIPDDSSTPFDHAQDRLRQAHRSEQALWPVEVDEGQLNQVITNLVINAEQAMPEGGIIKVSAENINIGAKYPPPLKSGKYVKISIEDQGVGIPKEHLPKIFDPYFTTKEKGSGLGLASAYSIINKHDGFITVESEVGVGTTFYIYLPASRKKVLRGKKEEEGPIVGKGKVLVMDDEEIIRDVAGEMLTSIGYEVEFATSGTEAIERYERARELKEPIDVVILDLTIPGGMGGKEAIEKLITIDPGVKAIVSSGYSHDPVMAEYNKYGFKGLIAKPYKIQELSRILYEVISEN